MPQVKTPYVYAVDEWNDSTKQWETNTRFYACEKSLTAFDLRSIPGKRKNATFKGKIE